MTEDVTKTDPKTGVPVHDVRDLTGPDGRAGLMLDGVLYTLRITQTGKLILTK